MDSFLRWAVQSASAQRTMGSPPGSSSSAGGCTWGAHYAHVHAPDYFKIRLTPGTLGAFARLKNFQSFHSQESTIRVCLCMFDFAPPSPSDHTIQNRSPLIRTAKSIWIGLHQYWVEGSPGNPECCWALLLHPRPTVCPTQSASEGEGTLFCE